MSEPTGHGGGATLAVIAAIVAIILVTGVIIFAAINPLALVGLAPALLAVAAIIRAVNRHGP